MKVNLHNAEFVSSAASKSGFQKDGKPAVAFAGRSNVGKSSTINALLNRKGFARVSESPGKTIHVNYFLIDKKVWLVDLPGYGYARVSKGERERWSILMEDFFRAGDALSLCVLVVDLRHAPTKDDITMCDYFKAAGYPYLVAANKADDVKKSELEANLLRVRQTLDLPDTVRVIPYSAKKKTGIAELLAAVSEAWESTGEGTGPSV